MSSVRKLTLVGTTLLAAAVPLAAAAAAPFAPRSQAGVT